MNQLPGQHERRDAVRRADVDGIAFAPRWAVDPLPEATAASGGPRVFLIPPSQGLLRRELAEAFPDDEVRLLDGGRQVVAPGAHLVFVSRATWADGVRDEDLTALLGLVRSLDGAGAITLDVVTDKAVTSPLFPGATHPVDGVHVGLARTLAAERPGWRVRCLCLRDLVPAELARVLDLPLPEHPGKALCVDAEQVATAGMGPVSLGEWPSRSAFREGGTYAILGGTGGLGGVLAEYLAERYRAEIVLVGRRPPERTEAARRRLLDLGASAAHHHQVDLADGQALRRALDRHEVLHGVVHSALVLDDATLATMTDRSLLDVLRPKVHGTRGLIQALRGRELDFCLFFSSVQSHLANPGQGNYAAASVAVDSYADLLREALLIDTRVVNWGYWGSVGVVATPEYRERMERLGIGSVEPAEGLAVVERLLAGEHRQVTVLKATREALRRMDITQHENTSTTLDSEPAGTTGLAALVPPFADDTPDAERNRELARRIEAYSRAALRRVELPAEAHPRHRRLLAAVRDIPDAPSATREELVSGHPELAGHLALLDRCVEHLPAVLRGEVDPLEVMFPGGSFELVAPVYRSNPIADYFNRVSGEVVAAFQREHSGRELRVLEIGAGTGSTTRFVLDRLDPRDVSYTFTDLSHAFLNRARDAFADHPFLRFEICDVTDPPADHDGAFDVVVATNVLHATADVPATLRNVRRMLREGGVLVLSEVTARQDYSTLTFGLTDGWWAGSDAYRIEHSPLLASEQWQRLLTEAGFGEVLPHGGPEQQVLVARAGPVADPAPVTTPAVDSTAEVTPTSAPAAAADVTERVEEYVRELIARTMRFAVAEVERDRPFRDMGIDSLIAVELLEPLRALVGYLPATVLFEFPTVAKLAAHLVDEHGDTVRDAFPAERAAAEPVVAQPEPTPPRPEPVVVRPESEFSRPEPVLPQAEPEVRAADIAIVGMSARLPGAPTVEEFWRNLVAGVDAVTAAPSERWRVDLTAGADPVSYTDRGAFLDDIDAFDHTFFGLTPHDAAVMDPQERLVLEQTYQALLDAGRGRETMAGSDTGVFVGVMNSGYAWYTPTDPAASPTTSLFWSMANRTSYHFDWHGPSMAVDTACSASLTALHLACQSLRAGECGQAVVSGVNLITHPRQFRLLSGMGMLSRSGVCRPFGEGADGFVDGEGVVCLVLKPLADALRDGDRVHGVIAGSAVNAGGRANGYTAPNIDAQHAVVTRALAAADVPPEGVGYVEAHGTGTELGDPVEVRALGKAYAAAGTERIRLGSVKSNIGHLESAAGLSGVLKAVLQMRHRRLVPTLHAERPNPHIDFPATPFVLNTRLTDWPESLPLVSAVSSFGAGGANAHVVLRGVVDSEPAPERSGRDRYVIPLSHHTSAGLQLLVDDLRAALTDRRVDLDALAHTLACRRDAFRHRVAIVCRDQDDLVRRLGVDLQRRTRRTPAGSADGPTDRTAEDVAALFESGGDPDWSAQYPARPPLALPGYPFLRHRHWVESAESGLGDLGGMVAAHRVAGEAVVPAAWSLALLAGHAQTGALAHVLWQRRITDPGAVETVVRGDDLSLVDRDSGEVFCTAEITEPGDVGRTPVPDATGLRRVDADEVYAGFRRAGYDYGSALRGVRWAEVGSDSVRAFLRVDRSWGQEVSPALLDAGMQLSILLSARDGADGRVFVPYHLGQMTVVRAPRDEAVFCHCQARPGSGSGRTRTFDFRFTDADGDPLVLLEEVVSVAVDGAAAPRRFEVLELSTGGSG
ncbi:beta-ketoacyl synthase N-terminal-like domain-containing protein [Umezawaea sp. NPDC059074]|uniref:beta-ketoacyl synthase N-terminal-like domain-containing protein n=1 Tax=Umezawaea sp. NPDC059074 TaxID=3346716 RepID=UPI0036851A44